jgi:hypothetical protein
MLQAGILLCSLFLFGKTFGQSSGVLNVQGDGSKYYPVVFYDGGWDNSMATTLEIGKSDVHKSSSDWWGSIIAKVRFHTTNWGNGSDFIDVDVRMKHANAGNMPLLAGWKDVTGVNGDHRIVIWLRGATSYAYKADYMVNPVPYDDVNRTLPYKTSNNEEYTFKTAIDPYVNISGSTNRHTAFYNGGGLNYFEGGVGLGTKLLSGHKLAVEGSIGARKIKVTQEAWADFVFEEDYQLPSLQELERYVKKNKHLPDVPSEKEVQQEGIDLGEMNKILLQKMEELTLYMIKLEKRSLEQESEIKMLKEKMVHLKKD